LDLWQAKKTNTNGILFVTHNIEEAVVLADRIVIFGSDPGYIRSELKVDLPHPRNSQDQPFRNLVDSIYTLMTTQPADLKGQIRRDYRSRAIGLGYRLPDADISELTGLLEIMDDPEHHGRIDLPALTELLHLNVDDLFPLTEVLEILGFAYVAKGDLMLSPAGKIFANADILERKKISALFLMNAPASAPTKSVF
jgi:NitT/TauT family transport system ATP-binding protein